MYRFCPSTSLFACYLLLRLLIKIKSFTFDLFATLRTQHKHERILKLKTISFQCANDHACDAAQIAIHRYHCLRCRLKVANRLLSIIHTILSIVGCIWRSLLTESVQTAMITSPLNSHAKPIALRDECVKMECH